MPQLQVKKTRGKREGLSEDAVAGLNLGGLGSAEVLSIDSLNVDMEYQRDLRHNLVNKIGREYDIVKAGPILVSAREDGSLWVVDGQHRMMGALQAGETEIFAHVVHGLSREQEADLRLARNDRMPDSMYEKFRTRLVKGEQKAHRMVEIVEQQGTMINTVPGQSHGVNAISTLEVLYDMNPGNGVWLGRVLRVLREAYIDPEDATKTMTPKIASASMLKAVAWFLTQHVDARQAKEAEFIERLGRAGVEDLRRKGANHKAAMGGSAWINQYRAIVEVWNFGRKGDNKLHWQTVGSLAALGNTGSPDNAALSFHNRRGGGEG